MVMEATPAFPHGPPSSNIKALGMSRGETVSPLHIEEGEMDWEAGDQWQIHFAHVI